MIDPALLRHRISYRLDLDVKPLNVRGSRITTSNRVALSHESQSIMGHPRSGTLPVTRRNVVLGRRKQDLPKDFFAGIARRWGASM